MKKPLQHFIVNSNEDVIKTFETFDKSVIKSYIVDYLTKHPNEEITHEKECRDKRFVGNDIINFYGVNPKSNKICKIITRGHKDYYQPLSI